MKNLNDELGRVFSSGSRRIIFWIQKRSHDHGDHSPCVEIFSHLGCPLRPWVCCCCCWTLGGTFPYEVMSLLLSFLTWLDWWMFSLCALVESGVERFCIWTCWCVPAHSSWGWTSLTSQAEFQLHHGVLYSILTWRLRLKKTSWRSCLPLEDQTEL